MKCKQLSKDATQGKKARRRRRRRTCTRALIPPSFFCQLQNKARNSIQNENAILSLSNFLFRLHTIIFFAVKLVVNEIVSRFVLKQLHNTDRHNNRAQQSKKRIDDAGYFISAVAKNKNEKKECTATTRRESSQLSHRRQTYRKSSSSSYILISLYRSIYHVSRLISSRAISRTRPADRNFDGKE